MQMDMNTNKKWWFLCICLSGIQIFMSCAMSGGSHSARIQPDGISEFGITFGYNSYTPIDTVENRPVSDSTWAIPIWLPEINYGISLSPHFEVGGRASILALGIEGYLKWGFLQKEKYALALVPSLCGRALPFGEGVSNISILGTYSFNKRFSLEGALFLAHAEVAESNNKEYEEWARKNLGSSNSAGVTIGFGINGETFFIRPMIEVSRVSPVNPDDVLWRPYDRASIMIHLGWLLGKEKQQLDRIEYKIDNLKPTK